MTTTEEAGVEALRSRQHALTLERIECRRQRIPWPPRTREQEAIVKARLLYSPTLRPACHASTAQWRKVDNLDGLAIWLGRDGSLAIERDFERLCELTKAEMTQFKEKKNARAETRAQESHIQKPHQEVYNDEPKKANREEI